MKKNNIKNAYLSLCYHYIRDKKNKKSHPKILGNSEEDFIEHVEMLQEEYHMINPKDALSFSCSDFCFDSERYGMLLTFDDGLSDHYLAAKILADRNIKAIFFVPTCIVTDKLPANPVIIHYALSEHGIDGFLKFYYKALNHLKLDKDENNIFLDKETMNSWEIIRQIKKKLKCNINYKDVRSILLYIYKNLLLENNPNIFELMHLSEKQIIEISNMGHSIGAHSHNHISIASSNLSDSDYEKEMIEPARHLEKLLNKKIEYLSYPFGRETDCFSSGQLSSRKNIYKLAFTIEERLNTKSVSPLELGRYMPTSKDDALFVRKKLLNIIKNIKSDL